MTEIVDIRNADDPRDVIHRAVVSLGQGRLVGLPTEAGYMIAGHLLQDSALERLQQLLGNEPDRNDAETVPFVCLRSAAEIHDYLPRLERLADRLCRRCWPGPVVLQLPVPAGEGLLNAVPEQANRIVRRESSVQWGCPSHDIVQSVTRLLPVPPTAVLFDNGSGSPVSAAEELASRAGDVAEFCIEAGLPQFDQPPTVVHVENNHWNVVRTGVITRNSLSRLASEIVVFVCTGNTCRSPMAEGLFRKYLAESLKSEVEELEQRGYLVLSAGLAASPGMPVSPQSVEALASAGVDLSDHLSRPLTPKLVQQADRIFTMTREHRDSIVATYPEAATRTELLSREGRDISDPIGLSQEAYDQCAEEIAQQVRSLVQDMHSTA